MVRFDFPIYIGCECKDRGPIIKCHDTGVTLGLHLKTVTKSKWMQVEEDYRIPDGTTAVIRVKKPDNTVVLTDDGITFEGGSTVVCSDLEQAYTAPGTCRAELSLYNPEGKRLTSATFTFEVESECVCDEDERSEDYMNVLGGVVQEVNAAAASAAESAAEAEEWAKKAAAGGGGGGGYIDSLTADKVTFSDGENFQQKYDSGKLTGPAGKDGAPGTDGKDGAPGTPGADGKDGEKGDKGDPFTYADFTPEQLASLVGPQGEPGADGADGKDGADGTPGVPGNGIASIERTAGNGAPGTTDTYTVTMTNGSTAELTVYNGKDGKDGVGGSGGSGDVYSTEEIVVGTWIDGKPIYRSFIILGTSYNVPKGTTCVVTGVDAESISQIIGGNLIVASTTDNDGGVSPATIWKSAADTMSFSSTEEWAAKSTRNICLVFDYTKSTDVATLPSATALAEAYEEGVNEA